MGATEDFAEEWDLEALWSALGQLWPVSIDHTVLEKEAGGRANLDRQELIDALKLDAHAAYDRRESEVGAEVMRELERQVILSVLDRKWREHLYEMDYLREGIYLRAYSQRDPLVEYQREGFDMFAAMMDGIKAEVVGFLFNLEVQVDEEVPEAEEEVVEPMRQPLPAAEGPVADGQHPDGHHGPLIRAKGLQRPQAPQKLTYAGPTETGEVEQRGQTVSNADDPYAGIGRNALCPCGSGKKFKKCHGAPGGPTGLTARPAG
jgi:preprotein translocase subunit SecA